MLAEIGKMAKLIKFSRNPDEEKNEAILERNRSLSIKSPTIELSENKVNTEVELKPLIEFMKSSTEEQPIQLR